MLYTISKVFSFMRCCNLSVHYLELVLSYALLEDKSRVANSACCGR